MPDNGRIIINYGKFEEHAKKIEQENKEMRDTLDNIQKKINSLEGDHESNSAVTTRKAITNMSSKFENYQQVVNSYVKFIRNVATQADTLEKTLDSNASQFHT